MKRSAFGPRKTGLKRSAFKLASKPTAMRRSGIKAKTKKASKADREHMGIVAGLCCIVCRNLGLGDSPAEVHHVRYLAGGGQRSSNLDTLPLCPNHHRLGGFGVAIHAGRKTWESKYGTEADLLAQTKRETGIEQREAA
jgi:Recombination enhancement, RecA-dependent nuclease